jgi:hypothetical protein
MIARAPDERRDADGRPWPDDSRHSMFDTVKVLGAGPPALPGRRDTGGRG